MHPMWSQMHVSFAAFDVPHTKPSHIQSKLGLALLGVESSQGVHVCVCVCFESNKGGVE